MTENTIKRRVGGNLLACIGTVAVILCKTECKEVGNFSHTIHVPDYSLFSISVLDDRKRLSLDGDIITYQKIRIPKWAWYDPASWFPETTTSHEKVEKTESVLGIRPLPKEKVGAVFSFKEYGLDLNIKIQGKKVTAHQKRQTQLKLFTEETVTNYDAETDSQETYGDVKIFGLVPLWKNDFPPYDGVKIAYREFMNSRHARIEKVLCERVCKFSVQTLETKIVPKKLDRFVSSLFPSTHSTKVYGAAGFDGHLTKVAYKNGTEIVGVYPWERTVDVDYATNSATSIFFKASSNGLNFSFGPYAEHSDIKVAWTNAQRPSAKVEMYIGKEVVRTKLCPSPEEGFATCLTAIEPNMAPFTASLYQDLKSAITAKIAATETEAKAMGQMSGRNKYPLSTFGNETGWVNRHDVENSIYAVESRYKLARKKAHGEPAL